MAEANLRKFPEGAPVTLCPVPKESVYCRCIKHKTHVSRHGYRHRQGVKGSYQVFSPQQANVLWLNVDTQVRGQHCVKQDDSPSHCWVRRFMGHKAHDVIASVHFIT